MPQAQTDTTKLPVQLNVHIPWDFREFLKAKAERDRTSVAALVKDALLSNYGREFNHEAKSR